MSEVHPFRGVLPPAALMSKVSAVPYDVVSTEEAVRLADGNPLSFLRVSRPEIELPPGTDIHSDIVYAKAAENYTRLKKAAPLTADAEPRIYLYAQTLGGRRQIGFAAVASVDDYDVGIIKKHEKTRKDKEDDRTRHILATRSHSGPVFLAYKDYKPLDEIAINVASSATPYAAFTAEDGTGHTLWRLDAVQSETVRKHFQAVSELYICDGHHRAASASRTRAAVRGSAGGGASEADYFLAVIFAASQLRILPYNRLVKDLNGYSKEAFLAAVSKKFDITPADSKVPPGYGAFCMYLDGQWILLKHKGPFEKLSAIARLDVSLLQDDLLGPILGIDDPRTSKRIDFVGGIRGAEELARRVDSDEMKVAFSMHPTTLGQLFDVADQGLVMPPKSTWFEPKLRDGVVGHDF